MSTESFAKKLQGSANEILGDLSKQLITVGAALLIFSVALSNLIGLSHTGLMRLCWLFHLLSILAGVLHQLRMAERMRIDADNILAGSAQKLYQPATGMEYVVSGPWRSERYLRLVQIALFLIGVGLTGISLLFS